jgi:Protein of unknown function (DUF2089)
MEDQVFITAFVRSHGSLKEMEQVFGVSYPTIKSRLTRIANSLQFVESNPTPSRAETLDRLQSDEMTAQDAIRGIGGFVLIDLSAVSTCNQRKSFLIGVPVVLAVSGVASGYTPRF